VKVLVTGANGLLGRELCKVLSQVHDVIGIVHSPVENPISKVDYVVMDLSKSLDFTALPTNIDIVFHLAQSSHFRDFPGGTKDTFQINTSCTLDLLEYCRIANGRRFFLASTGGVYGGQSGPIPEAGLLIPPSEIGFYFASKLAAEMFSSTYRQVFDVTVLRFFFMYGPLQKSDMFLPRLVHSVINGREITINESGGIRVNPILVDDVANLLSSFLDKELPPVINIGGADVVSIQEIANRIGELTSRTPKFVKQSNVVTDVIADIRIMLQLLDVNGLTPFNQGLELLVRSIHQND
jgi:nucleoside-diphosphate-sugar epimerase